MSLYHLFYQSQTLLPLGTPELLALLHQARAYNREHHLSGLLLHTPDGRFFQILEGEETVVRRLYYDHIVADPRPYHCRVIGAGACEQRSFADWNMGFRVANAQDLHTLLAAATPLLRGAVCAPAPRAPPAAAAAAGFCRRPRARNLPYWVSSSANYRVRATALPALERSR